MKQHFFYKTLVLDGNSDLIKFMREIHIVFISNNLTNKKHPSFSNRGGASERDFE